MVLFYDERRTKRVLEELERIVDGGRYVCLHAINFDQTKHEIKIWIGEGDSIPPNGNSVVDWIKSRIEKRYSPIADENFVYVFVPYKKHDQSDRKRRRRYVDFRRTTRWIFTRAIDRN